MSIVRDKIIAKAIWEANSGTWKPTVEEMQDFFRVAGINPPTTAMAKGSLYGGSKIYPQLPYGMWAPAGGKDADGNPKAMVIHWCGIFACYVLKKWGGLNVHWASSIGIKGSGVGRIENDPTLAAMQPGDVAWIRGAINSKGQYAWHHFIITKIDRGNNQFESVDGNSIGNAINWYSNNSPAASPGPKKLLNAGEDNRIRGYYRVAG
jgi:hypothetical protein